MTYNEWLKDGGCGCNHTPITPCEDGKCTCDEIFLEISNLHTDDDVLQRQIDEIVISGSGISSGDVQSMIEDNLQGYATEDWTEHQGYALKSEIPTVPTDVSAFNNDAGYLTEHQHLKTINNQSIIGDGNIEITASGGSVTVDSTLDGTSTNPVANSAITEAINTKLDASAYTPTDLTNYYTKQEVNSLIPTVPTSNSAFTNDMHYVTSAETANYVTSGAVETQITNHFWCGTQQQWSQISGSTEPNTLYLIY